MALDIQGLEHDMVFLSENTTPEETKSIANKWILRIQELVGLPSATIEFATIDKGSALVIETQDKEIKRLLQIINKREDDIARLDAELRQAKDRIADLEDKLRK